MLKAHREETGKRRELWSSPHASVTRHLEALTPSASPAALVHGPLCIFSLSEPPALNSPPSVARSLRRGSVWPPPVQLSISGSEWACGGGCGGQVRPLETEQRDFPTFSFLPVWFGVSHTLHCFCFLLSEARDLDWLPCPHW